MLEILQKMEGGELIGLLAVLGGLLTGIVAVIAAHWRSVRLAEMEASLKQQLIARGMSAPEIEQVLRASSHSPAPACGAFTGIPTTDKAELVKIMAEHGMEGEDIEKVLRAFDVTSNEGNSAVREKAKAVVHLVENGHAADGIVQVLRAFPPAADAGAVKRFV